MVSNPGLYAYRRSKTRIPSFNIWKIECCWHLYTLASGILRIIGKGEAPWQNRGLIQKEFKNRSIYPPELTVQYIAPMIFVFLKCSSLLRGFYYHTWNFPTLWARYTILLGILHVHVSCVPGRFMWTSLVSLGTSTIQSLNLLVLKQWSRGPEQFFFARD